MEKVVIIGGGVMGTAVGIHLANQGQQVNIWGTQWDIDIIKEMKEGRKHLGHGVDLPEGISLYFHGEMEEALSNTRLIVMAVISKGMESMTRALVPYLNENHIILSVTKGIDEASLSTMSAVIENSLADNLRKNIGIVKLGGPIIAKELVQARYSEGIFASKSIEAAKYAANLFKSPKFRVNITPDIDGVDLCAAFKNPYAIGMGMVEGLEEGTNNSKAALIARGATEMANIVEAYGGSRDTALGLAGVGDYYVTSQGGRNGKFGKLLGQGKDKDQALEAMNYQTVEGLANTLNGYRLLKKLEEEGKFSIKEKAPLFLQIYKVLYEGKEVKKAIEDYWEER